MGYEWGRTLQRTVRDVHVHVWQAEETHLGSYRFTVRDEQTHALLFSGYGWTEADVLERVRTWARLCGYTSIDDVGVRDIPLN